MRCAGKNVSPAQVGPKSSEDLLGKNVFVFLWDKREGFPAVKMNSATLWLQWKKSHQLFLHEGTGWWYRGGGRVVDISVCEPPDVGKADFCCAAHCASLKSRWCVSNTDTPKPPSIPCAEGDTICWSRNLQCCCHSSYGVTTSQGAYIFAGSGYGLMPLRPSNRMATAYL